MGGSSRRKKNQKKKQKETNRNRNHIVSRLCFFKSDQKTKQKSHQSKEVETALTPKSSLRHHPHTFAGSPLSLSLTHTYSLTTLLLSYSVLLSSSLFFPPLLSLSRRVWCHSGLLGLPRLGALIYTDARMRYCPGPGNYCSDYPRCGRLPETQVLPSESTLV